MQNLQEESTEEKLEKLKRMRDTHLIDELEYKARAQRVLDAEEAADNLRRIKRLFDENVISITEYKKNTEELLGVLGKKSNSKGNEQPQQGIVVDSRETLAKEIFKITHTPSTVSGKPSCVSTKECKALFCHRFNEHQAEEPLHTTLLNKELGQLYDILRGINTIPTKIDCENAIRLQKILCSNAFSSEKEMTEAMNKWANDLGIIMNPISIGKTETDGTHVLSSQNIYALILNREDKYDGCNADLQNLMYYSKFWTSEGGKTLRSVSVCPSILMTVQGSDVSIHGAVFESKGIVDDFYFSTNALPIDSDELLREDLARVTMGIRVITQHLENYYWNISSTSIIDPAMDGFPYVRSVQGVQFQYCSRIGTKSAFRAEIVGTKEPVVVKFTRRYSIHAHNSCPIAPKLLAWSQIAGGWTVIVMAEFNGEPLHLCSTEVRSKVKNEILSAVADMHGRGFVHGDLRTDNILANNLKATIIDFDWSGPQGEVRYPLFMNHAQVNWPVGASDGEIIEKQHDLFMLDSIFNS